MARPCEWQTINARSLDRRHFGPVYKGLRHVRLPATYLLHLKFQSRKHPDFKQHGTWAVVVGTNCVRRKMYWIKAINKAPMCWANRMLRLHADGTFAREAAKAAAARAAFEAELRESISNWKSWVPQEQWKSHLTLR